jgi:GxxExxY protein
MTDEGPRKKLTRDDLLFTEEVYQIVGAAMDVHRLLGPGFLEAVYQEALAIEFGLHGIPFTAQPSLKIAYRDGFLEKKYIADFITHGQIIIEIKSLPRLGSAETAQLLNYLRATNRPLGLLINFGAAGKLEWKRLANTNQGPSRPL